MSVRKSRVRPVPDFSRAHQLFESQMEARKKDMKKCTKVEEFNLSRGFLRGDGSSATPVQYPDISKPSPRHPDFMRLQANSVQRYIWNRGVEELRKSRDRSGKKRFELERPTTYGEPRGRQQTEGKPGQSDWSSIELSSDVNVPKPKDGMEMHCEPGLQRKAAGILKNTGKMDEATTGKKQVHRSGAALGRRPRVTFDIASPLRESPFSMPKRVLIRGRSFSPSMASPKPAASRMQVTCNRVPVESSNRIAQSARQERSQPQRVLLLSSGQQLTISQSCSRATCMGGFSRFRADSIAKAIDFNEELEEDGKLMFQDVSETAQPSVDTKIGVKTVKKKFAGLKESPVRKIHIDITGSEDSSVSSPLLRLNTNSDAMVRSPLLRKMERIERIDAKIRSRLPQPKGKVADKENQSGAKERKKQNARESAVAVDSQFDKIDITDYYRMRNSQDQMMEATSTSVRKDALEQSEMVDTFDANQTISKLEKKAQRLRRRSQLMEEKSSEHDNIMKKLDALQKKIDSMRMEFQSVNRTNCSVGSEGAGSYEHSISASDVPVLMRNKSNVCSSEASPLHDIRSDSVEFKMDLESREELCETPVVTCEVEPGCRVDNEWSDTLLNVAFEITPESKEDVEVPPFGVVSDIAPESEEDKVSDVLHVGMATESKSMEVQEVELQSEDDVLCNVTRVAANTELEFEGGVISDVPSISPGTEFQSKAEFEIEVPDICLEVESSSENLVRCDAPSSPFLADNSEWKENVDPLSKIASVEDFSVNDSIQNATDNSLRGAEPSERIVFKDITEIQTRAVMFDEDDGVFVVEESSDDSDLMNSEDFTEWSSSPIVLMNQCMTNLECELSSELSIALSPEDVLAECLAKVSISDRLETSNVEASPNMSSEFMQYNRYAWREGVDGGVRLFNPVAAALNDSETDDAHFVPISPSSP